MGTKRGETSGNDMLQNQILLSNIQELKEELEKKTNELKIQNEELKVQNEEILDLNYYLVEITQKNEEEKKLALERKLKQQGAKRLKKRDYIAPEEFFEKVSNYVYKCEDIHFIISRNRLAFFIVYFTGLRVSNLLLLNVRNLKELMYDSLGT